jgi:hypothetical protein
MPDIPGIAWAPSRSEQSTNLGSVKQALAIGQFGGPSALSFESSRRTLESLAVLDGMVGQVHLIGVLEQATDHRNGPRQSMDAHTLSVGQSSSDEFLLVPEETVRGKVGDEATSPDEARESLQHGATVFKPTEADLTHLGPSVLVRQEMVAQLLDCRAFFR